MLRSGPSFWSGPFVPALDPEGSLDLLQTYLIQMRKKFTEEKNWSIKFVSHNVFTLTLSFDKICSKLVNFFEKDERIVIYFIHIRNI